MGAWGIRNFENDDALELVAIVNEKNLSFQDLRSLIESVASIAVKEDSDYGPDAYESSQALVAIELFTALKGKPANDFPEEGQNWVENQKGKEVQSDIEELSRKAIKQIVMNSELEELWKEAGEYDAWKEILTDLEKRITE